VACSLAGGHLYIDGIECLDTIDRIHTVGVSSHCTAHSSLPYIVVLCNTFINQSINQCCSLLIRFYSSSREPTAAIVAADARHQVLVSTAASPTWHLQAHECADGTRFDLIAFTIQSNRIESSQVEEEYRAIQRTSIGSIVDDEAEAIVGEALGASDVASGNQAVAQQRRVVVGGLRDLVHSALGNHQAMHRRHGVDVAVIDGSGSGSAWRPWRGRSRCRAYSMAMQWSSS